MATKRVSSSSNASAVYAVMTAGAMAVLALVGWALYRSFNAPVATAVLTPPPPTRTSGDDEAAKAAVPRISVDDLHRRMQSNAITLIDVRTKEGWNSGHIAGAIHIPLASVESYLSYIPRDKPIVTYCT